MDKDCFWFITKDDNDVEKMNAQCVECHTEHSFGWFWEGTTRGYGDYDIKCVFCDKVIHEKEND